MGLLSHRGSKKGGSPAPASAKAQSSEADLAAAKIQAVKRGKKARFDAEEEKKKEEGAATTLQKLARGRSARTNKLGGDPEKLRPAQARNSGSTPERPGRLSRRVSFSSNPLNSTQQQFLMLIERIKAAFTECIAQISSAVPAPAAASEPTADESNYKVVEGTKPELSEKALAKVTALFKKIDDNGDGSITQEEAVKFWGKNWAKVNAQAMFNEVDDDNNGSVTFAEWLDFWKNVLAQPDYNEEEVLEEIDEIMQGGAWVDFNDGRSTA